MGGDRELEETDMCVEKMRKSNGEENIMKIYDIDL